MKQEIFLYILDVFVTPLSLLMILYIREIDFALTEVNSTLDLYPKCHIKLFHDYLNYHQLNHK